MKERKPLKIRGQFLRDHDGNVITPNEEQRAALSAKAQLIWAELETGHPHVLADEEGA